MASNNAGVFFFGTPLTMAKIRSVVRDADVIKSTEGGLTRILVVWPEVALTIVIDPGWNREVQLVRIRGWVSQFSDWERNSKSVTSFLAAISNTSTCYGAEISPGFDKEGKVVTFLKQLLGPQGGFFFAHNSVYNAEGQRILGMPGEPATLGSR